MENNLNYQGRAKARSEKITAKSARIEEKNKRIAAKGKKISDKNGYLFTDEQNYQNINLQDTEEYYEDDFEYVKPYPFFDYPYLAERKSPATVAAIILSAVSILLLVSLFVGIMFGLIPTQGIGGGNVNISGRPSISDGSYDEPTEMLEEFKKSVVVVSVERISGVGTGTGIILRSDGYIVTNYHVVSDTLSIFVKLYGEEGYTRAELVGFSEHDDIAVLKINKKGLRPATFAASCSDYLAGERVYAIGSPEGTDYSWSVTQGIISAVNRELKFYGADGVMTKKWRVIQTDTPVNPGNSGGPLIDSNGIVVGIVTSKLEENEGMGFALPADGATEIINAIIDKGSADHIKSTISSGRPLIGVTCVSVEADVWYKNTNEGIEIVTSEYASENPDNTFLPKESGVYVKYTDPGKDAYGKIKEGDIITKVNNVRVYTQYQLMGELYGFRGGDTVDITLYRNGKTITVKIKLVEAEIE